MICPKIQVADRQQLTPKQAIELMRLTVVAGQAMAKVMSAHGFNIGRINYQDNGNWRVFKPEGPSLHIHLDGRAMAAKTQKYGQALYFPSREEHPEFYAGLKPLTEEDVRDIGAEIKELLKKKEFSDSAWGLAEKKK